MIIGLTTHICHIGIDASAQGLVIRLSMNALDKSLHSCYVLTSFTQHTAFLIAG